MLAIDVMFVIPPGSLLLDVAGPAEAIRLANLHLSSSGQALRFNLRFCSPAPVSVTSVGLAVMGLERLPDRLVGPTWVIVVGQPSKVLEESCPGVESIIRWLKEVFAEAKDESTDRLMAICSGALLVARTGLLHGRACTTHHDLLHRLRDLAPGANVLGNRVFVVDGMVFTCAGITAGIDLALHNIGETCGEALATRVAEDMVVYARRAPGDTSRSPFLLHRQHLNPVVHRVQDAIAAAPTNEWSTAALASVAHVTQRHLLRLFLKHTGLSPNRYLRTIRLERARQFIACGSSVTLAAELAGFPSLSQLRRAWNAHWGGAPRDAIAAR